MARIARTQAFAKVAVDFAIILPMSDGTPLTGAPGAIDVFIPKSTAAIGKSCERSIRATIKKLYQVIENYTSFL